MPGSSQPVYFVSCPALYDRPAIYSSAPDEHLRFILLTWAALKTCQILRFRPDIAHVNDWQTALLPLILRTALAWDRLFEGTRTVLTIHNIGHQGTFDARILPSTGLAAVAQHFHQDLLRQGRINFLLTGILFAHAITTVSPTYAREIRTPEHGVGLDPFLRERRKVLFGILNGIDETEWSPEVDAHLPHRYSTSGRCSRRRGCRTSTRYPSSGSCPGSSGRRGSTCASTCCRCCWRATPCSWSCWGRASRSTRRSSRR
jgi:starch synthase